MYVLIDIKNFIKQLRITKVKISIVNIIVLLIQKL